MPTHASPKTRDGRTQEHTVIDPHGTLADPFTFDEVAAKFARLAAQVKVLQGMGAMRSAARELASAATLERFSRALRKGDLRAAGSAASALETA